MSTKPQVDPVTLSQWLGQEHPPTPQQAAIIGAPPGPMLVVAGAGAGKTETMAARVVWLVANGYCAPEQVLGLTFTKKAAQQLSQRIRLRLQALARVPQLAEIDPDGSIRESLKAITPTVATYDSYAATLIQEYGLLLPVEPGARTITQAETYHIALEVVRQHQGTLDTTVLPGSLVNRVLRLASEMDNHVVSSQEVIDESRLLVEMVDTLPNKDPDGPTPGKPNQALLKVRDRQLDRNALLPIVEEFRAELKRRAVVTFGEQMSMAARLVMSHPRVGASQRKRYRVVMLDEYQDTSHSQRLLLRSLFGGVDPELSVTAVGDPMQAIYGWRGATAANLPRFTRDFPDITAGTPAPKKELTTSWRNPPAVLDWANIVADAVFGTGAPRPVQPLQARPGSAPGHTDLRWFATPEEEVQWVADHMAQRYADGVGAGGFTGAVLVRKRAHMRSVADALRARGVPVEIVGDAGLLKIPEVADMLAVATMLIRPEDTEAALRVVCGPSVGLSLADLQALAARAKNLSARVSADDDAAGKAQAPDLDAAGRIVSHLREQIDGAVSQEPEARVGLADAVADLGEPERFSVEGYARLQDLAAALRYMRTHTLSQSLPDIFNDIERVMGIRTEVLSRANPHEDGAAGTAHLDAFATVVADFSRIPGASLESFLDYVQLATEHEDGLAPGEVQVRADRVQILTVHKSKGLEWDHVAVLHADNSTYFADGSRPGAKHSNWTTSVDQLPVSLRGDCEEPGDTPGTGIPELDLSDVTTLNELSAAIEQHKKDYHAELREADRRLFYVALTRAADSLTISGNWQMGAPIDLVARLAKLNPAEDEQWTVPDKPKLPMGLRDALSILGEDDTPEETPLNPKLIPIAVQRRLAQRDVIIPSRPLEDLDESIGSYPRDYLGQRREQVEHGAGLVAEALDNLPEATAEAELDQLWEQEATALIDEHTRLNQPVTHVDIGTRLTASDMVSLKDDPERFARRLRRPVPFKPNSYAKRGTALHQWLEDRFGGSGLIDEDDLPGMGELYEDPHADNLQELKDKFLASKWAARTPMYVEHPFEVKIGTHLVRGRIDAIFKDEDGWLVLDWKTGKPPRARSTKEMEAAIIQLAVYREAWAQLLSEHSGQPVSPLGIRAAFHYIAWDETFTPNELPDAEALAAMLEA